MGRNALCFSGQGAQKVGMFKNLFEDCEEVRHIFNVASHVCDFDVATICFNGPKELLNQTIYTQPCVLTCDIAAGIALRERGFRAEYVSGFSLGEYAALYMAGCVTLEDVFRLIKIRSEAMQNAVPIGKGGMLAVITQDFKFIEKLCSKLHCFVQISNYNSTSQVVVSGLTEGIDLLERELKARSIKCMKLPVSAPFHCKLMRPAMDRLQKEFDQIVFMKPNIPIVMNFDGNIETEMEEIKHKILLQTISPVKWINGIRTMQQAGVDFFVECGPGNTLYKFIKSSTSSEIVLNVNNSYTLKEVLRIWESRK